MNIAKNSVVSFYYTLSSDSGEVIDTNVEGDVLSYIHGTGSIVQGLEQVMEGKNEGDSFTTVVAPEEGYGHYDDELLFSVPKESFKEPEKVEIGMSVEVQSKEGMRILQIKNIDGESVLLDGNHPLAGATLHFEISISEVREATAEELSHGHVHN
jgi:FKBP-type peptidyl-prolyl cis-trans isomerase SlyD